MSNLNLIINFYTILYNSVLNGSSVYSCVRTNINKISNKNGT